jgi:hypothetical protein
MKDWMRSLMSNPLGFSFQLAEVYAGVESSVVASEN